MQNAATVIISLVLLLAAVLFTRSQFQTLRWLRRQPPLMPEDVAYFRRRVVRRLLGCGLMVLLAAQMLGLFFFGILDSLDALIARAQAADADALHLTPAEEVAVRRSYTYLGAIVLILFLLLGLAFVDLMALRRYGMRQRRRLREDRQAMLERQLPLLRRQRSDRTAGNGEA
jgi:hypothetical protein